MNKHSNIFNCFRLITSLLVCVFMSAPVEAQNFRNKGKPRRKPQPKTLHSYDYGLGLAMGAGVYSGFSGVYMLPKDAYIQAQLGIQVLNATFGSSVDYIIEFPHFISRTTVPYVGVGGIFVYGADYASIISDAEGDFHLGVRSPIGVYTLLSDLPIQFFGEAIPGFLLVAETVPVFGVNLGFRWFFK